MASLHYFHQSRCFYEAKRVETITSFSYGQATSIKDPAIWLPNPMANHFAEFGAWMVAVKQEFSGVEPAEAACTDKQTPSQEQ